MSTNHRINLLVLSLIASVCYAEVSQSNVPSEQESRKRALLSLSSYKNAEYYFKKSTGDVSRTVSMLLGENSSTEDKKFLSLSLAQYGFPPRTSFDIHGTQLKLVTRDRSYFIEIENYFQGEIKVDKRSMKFSPNHEDLSLQEKYRELQKMISSYLTQEKRKETSFLDWSIFQLILPRAEAAASWFPRVFAGAGSSLLAAGQRVRGLRVDPNVPSGAVGRSGPARDTQRWWEGRFGSYTPPNTSGGSWNTSGRRVYELPGGGRLSTYGNPPPGARSH